MAGLTREQLEAKREEARKILEAQRAEPANSGLFTMAEEELDAKLAELGIRYAEEAKVSAETKRTVLAAMTGQLGTPILSGGQAAYVQERSPGEKIVPFVKDPNFHYVIVEEMHPNAQTDLLGDYLCLTSPVANVGYPLYEDLGFVRGVTTNTRQHLLKCDIRDAKYMMTLAATESRDKALGSSFIPDTADGAITKGGMNVSKERPKGISELGVNREVDPVTHY